MNGIHDMGGMHGMGPIEREENEPVFHEPWEGRVFALNVLAPVGKSNIDYGRHGVERLPPADYLRMSYYEKWLARLEHVLVDRGVVTRKEADTGKPEPGTGKATPAVSLEDLRALLRRGPRYRRDASIAPRFQVNERVRARNMNPVGHTRLPRYVRGKSGTISRDHGVFVFPDTNARFEGENPQHVYSVRFAAQDLWGEQASRRDAVYLDLWDDYLERA